MNGDETLRLDLEIKELLALLAEPDLSLGEAEQVLDRLLPDPTVPREQIVDRILDMLEAFSEPPPDARGTLETAPHASSYDAALILLTYLGDETVVPRLLALIAQESLPDDFKLKLISIVHEFDPEAGADDLMRYLDNPYKAMQESHREHLRRLQTPLELGMWLDVMGAEMPTDARASFARTSAEVDEPLAVPLLICMCYDDDPQVALAAMDAVERYKDARALPALEELATRHPLDMVRTEARKTADRLRIRASLTPQVEPSSPPSLGFCYLTTIDGMGGQVAVLTRHLLPGMLRVAQTVFGDEMGIEYCFGMDILAHDLEDLLDELAHRGLSPVKVSYAELIETLGMACEATWSAERLLPASFVAWRSWMTWEWAHDESAIGNVLVPKESSDLQALSSALSTRERRRLLDDSPDLLYQDEFALWLFEKDEVDDLGDAFWELVEKNGGSRPKVSAVRALLGQAVRRIVTDRMRGLIRDRLRRVAPLLRDLYVEDEVWQWAVVAADALADDSPLPLEEHPLLLAMAAHSLENVVGAEVRWRR
jgi:hypothetical protein